MKYWIVPSKDSIFRIDDAIREQGGLVDWRMSNNFHLGDVVFIYKAKPVQCIRYKMEVVALGLDDETSLYQERFWADKSIYYDGLENCRYVRFKLIEEYADDIAELYKTVLSLSRQKQRRDNNIKFGKKLYIIYI